MNRWRAGKGILGAVAVLGLAVGSSPSPRATPIPIPCGPTWQVVDGPNVGDGNNFLVAVSGTSSSDVWAVGNYEITPYVPQTLMAHFDGTAWAVIPSPNVGEGYNNYLTAVAAISTKDAWAVGYYESLEVNPTPLILHWDGSTWSIVEVPELPGAGRGVFLWAVTALASDDVWAVGVQDIGSTTLSLHWNGVAWKLITSPDAGDSANVLKAVTANSSTDVWAAGYYYAGADGYQPLAQHWDGVSWTVVPSPALGERILLAADALASDDVWAVGATGSPVESLTGAWAQHWDGKAWVDVPIQTDRAEHFLSGVAAPGADDVWTSGEQFPIEPGPLASLSDHWDGTAWTAASIPNVGTGDNTLAGLTAIPTGELFSVGSYVDARTGAYRTLTQQLCPIQVRQTGFSPPTVHAKRGDTVAWSISDQEDDSHSVTDGTRLLLFNSGLRSPGSAFTFTFVGAGDYRVLDGAAGHTMLVRVPMAALGRETRSTIFRTITAHNFCKMTSRVTSIQLSSSTTGWWPSSMTTCREDAPA